MENSLKNANKKGLTLLLSLFIIVWSCVKVAEQKDEEFDLPLNCPSTYQSMADRIYLSLERQAHYLLSTTHTHQGNANLKLLTKSQHCEDGVRPNTGAVLGFSFLYRFGKYDAKEIGVNRDELLQKSIIPMMNYLVMTYDSIPTADGKYWKEQWQSAHWAHSLGRAAWYLGDSLPRILHHRICTIVEKEAERFYYTTPPAQLKKDTKSEENAWNSQIFHIASLLMPNHQEVKRWQELFKRWVLSAYVCQEDIGSDIVVDGVPLNSFKAPNVYNDYTIENNGIVHPDYMNAYILSQQLAVDYKLLGKKVPDFLLYNTKKLYRNTKWLTLPDGGLAYPNGQGWRLFRNPDWLINHIYMAVFAKDPNAMYYAKEALACTEAMQARHPQGNIYAPDEYFFASAQHDLMIFNSCAWLALHYAQRVEDNYTPLIGTREFVRGKFIVNRTSNYVHTLYYGDRLLLIPTFNKQDRIFAPCYRSGIGYIKDKNGKILPTKIISKELFKTEKEFVAYIVVQHGDKIQANYQIKSDQTGLHVNEEITAIEPCELSQIATSRFGILNNKSWIRENGVRSLYHNNKKVMDFVALSGKQQPIYFHQFTIDKAKFDLKKQNLFPYYQCAKKNSHGRSVDIITLNYYNQPRKFTKYEIISKIEYQIFCP